MSPSNRLSPRHDGVEDPQSSSSPQRQLKEPKLMKKSGQTDADRRGLRNDFRRLNREISNKADELVNPLSNAFRNVRHENNGLYSKVAYVREAVLDGDNVDLITSQAVHQVDGLVSVPRYDVVRLTEKLIHKCSTRTGDSSVVFDWKTLGKAAGSCFNAVPSHVTFLSGPLPVGYQPKERKRRAKRKIESDSDEEEEAEEESLEKLQKEAKSSNHLSAVERNIMVVSKTLKERAREVHERKKQKLEATAFASPQDRKQAFTKLKRNGYDIDAIQYLFNPQSFTQTVENLFHFSFLIKHGQARINVGKGGPCVRPVQDNKKKGNPPDRQAVLAFTMKDWRELCKAHDVEEGDIPHRSDETARAKDAKEDCDSDDRQESE